MVSRLLRWSGCAAGIVVLVAGAGVAGFALRGCFAPCALPPPRATGEQGETSPAKATLWVCSMNITYHPYYSSDRPGKCKFCDMELIPAESGEATGMRRFTTSAAGAALMDIQTSPVERRFVRAQIRMVGKVAYDETRVGYITAWVPGRLDRLYVDYTGIKVHKGDHMVDLYSPELLSAQEELLQALRAVRELSASNVEIIRETAEATVTAVREKLRLWGLKEEQVRQIEERGTPTDHVTIYAPMGGTVVHKNAQKGMYVRTGTRIYTIVDLSSVWVKLDAYESDLEWLRYGQKVTFAADAYPGEQFVGKIAFLDPVVDPKTRTVKVRVNVPNPDGKLKPDMFVHGLVRPNVAKGGRVMAPDLAGKWICRMHPEIIKAGAGTCDVCGMALVTPESLGYLPLAEEEAARPLVIPASAALVTGTRAIVYVQDTDAEKPTFNGREIVLGHRAGDYYIVRHGLEEGELVVTNGNFKIDSALQIQAQPSMMSPQGGGGGGGHEHGGGPAGGASPEGQAMAMEMKVPEAALGQLRAVDAACGAVFAGMKAGDLERSRGAFRELGTALEAVEGDLLSGHARMTWEELSMLLANDAFEGGEAGDLEAARRVLEPLEEHARRLREQFRIRHAHERTAEPPSGTPDPTDSEGGHEHGRQH